MEREDLLKRAKNWLSDTIYQELREYEEDADLQLTNMEAYDILIEIANEVIGGNR